MKRARIIVLAIALLAAGAAALIAKSLIGKAPETKTVVKTNYETTEVLVANADIGLGASLKPADLRWQAWPSDAVTHGYITKRTSPRAKSEFQGSLARAPFLAGEPIKKKKLIKANEGGVMAAILPAGMRAISTQIAPESAVGGFILPNDRVDVILTRRDRSGNKREQYVSDTLFHNIRVLAIGQAIETKDGEKVASGKTATLALSPRQAESLALARSIGEISLVLRSLSDSRTSGKGPQNSINERSNSINTLRYGDKAQAFGVK
ncbi:MAG: Flp pilus assembly protein CpaB [Pseudomonadota bacterium]